MDGRLRARPRDPAHIAAPVPGTHSLEALSPRPGLLHVPEVLRPPAPLLVAFHGSGGDAQAVLRLLRPAAERHGVLLVLPESHGPTWDVIRGGFGRDVEALDAALDRVFSTVPADPCRLALGGFSDGASYALSLGVTNGDVFHAALAFSPGFAAPETTRDHPRLFVSHGTWDLVLPIDVCSRRLVPVLRRAGFPLRYTEFLGGHEVPATIADEALRWLTEGAPV